MEDDEWIQLTPTIEIPEHAEWKMCTFETHVGLPESGDLPEYDARLVRANDGWTRWFGFLRMSVTSLADAPTHTTEWVQTDDDGPVVWRFRRPVDGQVVTETHYVQYFYRLCMNDYVMK